MKNGTSGAAAAPFATKLFHLIDFPIYTKRLVIRPLRVADAELAVESKSDMIIVNVHMLTAKNEPVQDSEPAVILLEGKTKTNIDKTIDGKKLSAGNYIMSVVSEGKISASMLA